MKNDILRRKIKKYRQMGYKPHAISKLTGVPIVDIVKICVNVSEKPLSTSEKLLTISLDLRLTKLLPRSS